MVGPAQKVGIVVEVVVFGLVVLFVFELLQFSGVQGLGLVFGVVAVLVLLTVFTGLSLTLVDLFSDGVGKTRNALRHRWD